jgi:hypothetical protein
MKKSTVFLLFTAYCSLVTVLAGCNKNPVTQLVQPSTVNTSSQWSGTFTLYDDDLKTGGGVMGIGWGPNFVVDFNSRENPYAGVKCIKIDWDGNKVTTSNGEFFTYTGFSLIAALSYVDVLNVSKNLTPGGYKKVTFWARKSSMASNTVLRVESPNGSSTSTPPTNALETALTDSWQKYSFDITGSLAVVRQYVNIILKTTDNKQGSGATIYIDDIKFTQ